METKEQKKKLYRKDVTNDRYRFALAACNCSNLFHPEHGIHPRIPFPKWERSNVSQMVRLGLERGLVFVLHTYHEEHLGSNHEGRVSTRILSHGDLYRRYGGGVGSHDEAAD